MTPRLESQKSSIVAVLSADKPCNAHGKESKNGKARVFTYRIRGFVRFVARLTWVPFEMTKIASASEAGSGEAIASAVDASTEPEFKPLTADEAQAWRLKNPALSPWRIIGLQMGAGGLMVLLAWLLLGQTIAPIQVVGGLVVVATVIALGLRKQ